MNKELEALKRIEKRIYGDIPETGAVVDDDLYIIETALKKAREDEEKLKDYDDIKHICNFYDIEFSLPNIREALFTFAQLKGEYGANWSNYNKKLKALEIITNKIKIEFNNHFLGIKGNYYIIVNNDVLGAIKVDKEKYDILKEVLK